MNPSAWLKRAGLTGGLMAAVAFTAQCHQAGEVGLATTRLGLTEVAQASPAALVPEPDSNDPLDLVAREDPFELLHLALERYEQSVRSYRCTFIRQERINGQLRPAETMRVLFRDEPFSVRMEWVEDPRPAQVVLYVEGRWTGQDGEALAWVRPNPLAALLVPQLQVPIHGVRAAQMSRRSIDQFGFANILRLILQYAELADQRGELTMRYLGKKEVGGRLCYVLERILPYDPAAGEDNEYPDRRLIICLDAELLLPVVCLSYADDAQEVLLGSYIFRDIELNVPVSDADFDPAVVFASP